MSCEKCDKSQEGGESAYWFMYGNTKIAVYGCQKHVREIAEKLEMEL